MSCTRSVLAACAIASTASADLVNFESAHVHPLEIAPGRSLIAAVNTADHRLEVYRFDGPDDLAPMGSVPVGIEPVSVRGRTAREFWVVNRVSDSISVVDINTMNVVRTINVGDEPGDVVFAEGRAFVSCGTDNQVWVYDVSDLSAAPAIIDIEGEDPRALATDGRTVYGAIFNAGNGTSVLNHAIVTRESINPYPSDTYPWGNNPPPNSDMDFDPPVNPALLVDADGNGELDRPMPPSSMILKQDAGGNWFDDNGRDWNAGPTWTLNLHAMFAIDADSLAVTYTEGLLTTQPAIDVARNGTVAIVGTEAFNQVRFEPVLNGRFAISAIGYVRPDGAVAVEDLNPHLAGLLPAPGALNFEGLLPFEPLSPEERAVSLGDPRGVASSPDATWQLVTGRGSNNIVKVSPDGTRLGLGTVGAGPTGVVIDAARERAYVLNRFDATISTVHLSTLDEMSTTSFHDPTPQTIRDGRAVFYNTHLSSGLGHVSCQTCHVDGATDLLSWDLGDPSGEMKEFNQTCIADAPQCDELDWHPMKGPMATQTLFGIIGTEPLHWRGDREDLAAFNPAFEHLLGAGEISAGQMDAFEALVSELRYPPNPWRELDGALPAVGFGGGDPARGEILFMAPLPGGMALAMGPGHPTITGTLPKQQMAMGDEPTGLNCIACHALPTGTNSQIMRTIGAPGNGIGFIPHLTKVAQLRDLYRKDGFDFDSPEEIRRGTGFLHDGSIDTLDTFASTFLHIVDEVDRRDLVSFLFALGTDTLGGIGASVTIDGTSPAEMVRRDELIAVAESGAAALIAKGRFGNQHRGWSYIGSGVFQSDRVAEQHDLVTLDQAAGPGDEITYMLVEFGTERRMGLDRDRDGFFDRDELDACHDPADPESFPGDGFCCGDFNFDGTVDLEDLFILRADWGLCAPPCATDLNGDGQVNFDDLDLLLGFFGDCR